MILVRHGCDVRLGGHILSDSVFIHSDLVRELVGVHYVVDKGMFEVKRSCGYMSCQRLGRGWGGGACAGGGKVTFKSLLVGSDFWLQTDQIELQASAVDDLLYELGKSHLGPASQKHTDRIFLLHR